MFAVGKTAHSATCLHMGRLVLACVCSVCVVHVVCSLANDLLPSTEVAGASGGCPHFTIQQCYIEGKQGRWFL